jgi:hypothetical protein
LDNNAMERLAFWAKNMTSLSDAGMQWPGFSYTDAEQARMSQLAGRVSDAAYGKFLVINTLVFIALAAAGIVGIFLPLATVLFPIPAETKPLPFVLLLAATALLIIGIGLPISMRIAAALSSDTSMRTGLIASPGDAELAHKVAFQINRITVIMCGVFVPGTMLWIAFNIQAGPLITALKWLSFAALAASIAYSRVAKKPG